MDIERAVVSKAVTTGRCEQALAKGIRPEHFVDDACRIVFEWVLETTREYGVQPSLSATQAEHPEFEIVHQDDAFDYLIDSFIKQIKKRTAQDLLLEMAEAVDDPDRAANIDLTFLEASRQLATSVPSSKVSLWKENAIARVDEYEQKVEEGQPPGLMFGFPYLDDATGGLQPHEMVTVLGFSGLGKSTLLMTLAHNIWAKGHRPLYISLEMEAAAISRKLDAMIHSIDYWKMKQLRLTEFEVEQWRTRAKRAKSLVGEIPIIDNIRHCTPDAIWGETIRHKPDVVIIDYLSLMRSGRPSHRGGAPMWQVITEITNDLKQNARTLHVPIIAAAQTNRSGAKDGAELDNVGGAISIIQDSDIVLGLFADKEMREQNLMEIRINKNRDGRLGSFEAFWNYQKSIFREAGAEDIKNIFKSRKS